MRLIASLMALHAGMAIDGDCMQVRSETDLVLQAQQDALTPFQVRAADGCHLNRRTLETIKAAGFAHPDASYFELSGFLWLNPTVAGIAIKGQV